MKRYVIGDVRGALPMLEAMIDKLGPAEGDSITFTGSYLGPGSDSKGVVEYIFKLKEKLKNVNCLRGCYEYMFGFVIETKPAMENVELWTKMGGEQVFNSYKSSEARLHVMSVGSNGHPPPKTLHGQHLTIPKTHIDFFASLHQWFEDDVFPYIVCHCGGHPALFGGKMDNERQTVFSENGWWEQDGRRIPGKTVIFSHVPFPKPFHRAGKLGIDLGAGLGGKLCAFEMFSETVTIIAPKEGV